MGGRGRGRRKEEEGRRQEAGGRRKEEEGRRQEEEGRRKAPVSCTALMCQSCVVILKTFQESAPPQRSEQPFDSEVIPTGWPVCGLRPTLSSTTLSETEIETETGRDRQKQAETQRQTETCRDRQTEGQRGTERERDLVVDHNAPVSVRANLGRVSLPLHLLRQ